MNEFVFTTEKVLKKGDVKLKVLTDGIDLKQRFEVNPIMLFNHDYSKPIGKWANVRKEGKKIVGTPVFDDIQLARDIESQVENNTLKSVSIGIDIIEAEMIKGILVIKKSVLLEVSIVSIPANTDAKKIEFSLENSITFSQNGKEVDISQIKYDMDLEKVTAELAEKKVELKNANALSLSYEKDIDKLKEEAKIKDAKIAALEASNEKLNLSNENNTSEVERLKQEIETIKLTAENEKKEEAFNKALARNKALADKKESLMKLSYELLVSMLDIAAPERASLSAEIEKNKSKTENTDTNYLKFKNSIVEGNVELFKKEYGEDLYNKYLEKFETENN